LFIVAGINRSMSVTGVANTLGAKGFPQPTAFGYAVAAIELVGGVLVLVGWKTRFAALALLVFTLGTIFISHNFWDMQGQARAMNQSQALKNLAIMGGLLMIAAVGPGRFSLDGRGRA
jgi:putative oxidoreductase